MSETQAPSLFPRFAQDVVEEARADTRVVAIHGARQVGKSTLASKVLGAREGARFLSLDDPAVLAAARSDPVTFVRHPGTLGIDEIQRAPELLLPIKVRVDEEGRPGSFLLTGSANVLMLPRLADALVGRLEVVELWPLSQGEIRSRRERFVDRLFDPPEDWPVAEALGKREVLELAVAGGFPEARARAPSRRCAWFEAYLRTFSERDVRDIADVEHGRRLRTLLTLLAARTGGLLNADDLGRDARIPASTTRRLLAVLEAAHLLVRLPAWSTNATQRVVSAPKAYLVDSALCAHLLEADLDALAEPTGSAGPVLETFALTEVCKQLGWTSTRATLHHARTKDKVEVDAVLVDRRRRVAGVEVKAGATVGPADFRGLRWLEERNPDRFTQGVVLYAGDKSLAFGPRLRALPFSALWA